jgi:hypothetical protein
MSAMWHLGFNKILSIFGNLHKASWLKMLIGPKLFRCHVHIVLEGFLMIYEHLLGNLSRDPATYY